jgi:hypothetical protein
LRILALLFLTIIFVLPSCGEEEKKEGKDEKVDVENVVDEDSVKEDVDESIMEPLSCMGDKCSNHDDCPCDANVCMPPSPMDDGLYCTYGDCDIDDDQSCPEGFLCAEVPDFAQSYVNGAATVCSKDQ